MKTKKKISEMKLSDFDYQMPKDLIAQTPRDKRDSSKLLILKKESGRIVHSRFSKLHDFLKAGDFLVLNDSKVIPARIFGIKERTGGSVEILLDTPINDYGWWIIGKRIREGIRIKFANSNLNCVIGESVNGRRRAIFNLGKEKLLEEIDRIGYTPLPPYIKTDDLIIKNRKLRDKYQTVYAQNLGSVAAPTAGLHFTKKFLKDLERSGVQIGKVTLHVGSGTFLPVKTQKIEDHKMHREFFSVNTKVYDDIIRAKREGRRIVAVGTTSARVLETIVAQTENIRRKKTEKNQMSKTKYQNESSKNLKADNQQPKADVISGWTDIFIYPGYEFKAVDALITNFHLPKSTLLMLVSAFAGRENLMEAYKKAIKKKYFFYSFGDAMLII